MKTFPKYTPKDFEGKWQKRWLDEKVYSAEENKPNKYYMLVELSYTSGDLHMGHWFAWSAPDAFARFQRMRGQNVLFPVGGFDSFGLPAENAAIKHGIHPNDWSYKNTTTMREQFRTIGPSFDWDKEVITSDPDYYRWTQWLFLEFYKSGLAYRGKVWSNWCPMCKTVLANEHVENGCCWRHTSTPVEQKLVDQWLIKITDYADKLIWPAYAKDSAGKPSVASASVDLSAETSAGVDLSAVASAEVDWPKAHKEAQNKWIGKAKGLSIQFQIADTKTRIDVWTKRWETVFGTTFLVLSPEHPILEEIKIPDEYKNEVNKYIKISRNKTERQRKEGENDKTGVFTGLFAVNPANNKKVPIWVSDYVLLGVGTGAVMGVPAHDRRDYDFAKKYHLDIVQVVSYKGEAPHEGNGPLINSGGFDGMEAWGEGKAKIAEWLTNKGLAKWQITYHLRDWSVSRRRYWGAPVPIIYCQNCWNKESSKKGLREGIDWAEVDGKKYMVRMVPEKDLPVTLPEKVDYIPTGMAPLATNPEWVKTKCPVCGKEAMREVETLDTYVDSSWYFFRYPSPKYDKGPFDRKVIREWMPIKVYFGGPEHILGHTLYARFITKFLKDKGYITFDEFALKRINHGVILGPDGYRMSKSRGNVVNPDEQVAKFGADSVRIYICFLGPHDKGSAWKPEGIEGSFRFLKRVWRLVNEAKPQVVENEKVSIGVNRLMNKTIQKVSDDLGRLDTHTAIAAIMEYVNVLEKTKFRSLDNLKTLLLLLAPFAPHITEELWVNTLGQKFSIHRGPWPEFDAKLAREEQSVIVIQVDGKLRGTLVVSKSELESKDKSTLEEKARKDPKVAKWLSGKKIAKVIEVPGKLINFVLSN